MYVGTCRFLRIHLDPVFDRCAWNLDEISASLGVSRKVFARIVEESIGIGGKAWLRRIRAVRACKLLRCGHKVAYVAQRLGFRHQPDFTREFGQMLGVSPSRFRRSEKARMFDPGKS